MSRFQYLNLDILNIVFRYLKQSNYVTSSPNLFVSFHSQDTLQCQLTCRSWAYLAQRNIYRRVVLNSIGEIELFVRTLKNSSVGTSVKYIYFPNGAGDIEVRQRILFYIREIATYCTFLRAFRIMSDDYVNIWKLIRYERMNGNFRMLEAIPSNEYQTDVNSYIYQSVAFCLQETLREIIIYDKNVPLDQAYVWKFPKMKTVFFEFNDYIDPGSINRNMETFPSATDIEIDVENPEESQVQVSTGFHRPVFRYVTKLSIRGRYHNTGISSYIMESFPRLQEITIFAASTSSRQLALSTEEAVRFLDYLVCVQKFNVSSIPISDQYGVMLGFYGGNRYTDKLKVRYESNSFISGSQRLNFETDSQVEGLIQIGIFHEHGIIPFLPRIGLIERSGGNLQFLELDMGMSAVTDMVAALPNKHKGVNLSTILRQCPQLRDIYILNTGLEEFGEDLQFENGKVINGHLSFTNSIFHTSFLPGLSFRVHYISHLTLKNCLFWNIPSCEMMREIDLRNTELRTITCEYMLSVEKINLKLIKTQTNVTQWCLIQHNRVFLSSEQDFNYSVQTQNNLSLTICCRNIFSVNFIINGHNATFNP